LAAKRGTRFNSTTSASAGITLKFRKTTRGWSFTDLESTNGTKVNGEDIQLRILRYGDIISVGRSVILFGSRDQIAERLARLRADDSDPGAATLEPEQLERAMHASSLDFELNCPKTNDLQATLHALDPRDPGANVTGPGSSAFGVAGISAHPPAEFSSPPFKSKGGKRQDSPGCPAVASDCRLTIARGGVSEADWESVGFVSSERDGSQQSLPTAIDPEEEELPRARRSSSEDEYEALPFRSPQLLVASSAF